MSKPQTPKEFIDLYTEAVAQHSAAIERREWFVSPESRKTLALRATEHAALAQKFARDLAYLYQDRDTETGYAWQEISDYWKGYAGR